MYFAYLQAHPDIPISEQLSTIFLWCKDHDIELANHLTVNHNRHDLSLFLKLWESINIEQGDRIITFHSNLVAASNRTSNATSSDVRKAQRMKKEVISATNESKRSQFRNQLPQDHAI